MPFYEYAVTTPANTAAAAPLVTEVALSPGRLVGVAVQIPRGCVGLVHAQIKRELHQLYPTNPDGNVSGDNAIVAWVEDRILDEEPYLVQLVTWNEDDSYAHTLTFRFNIISMDVIRAELERAARQDALRERALASPEAP